MASTAFSPCCAFAFVGSTFKTVEEPFLVTSDDGWFRPVDLKTGPDGALYVADFYEKRISHVDPRDTWDRTTGRLFRVRPADWKPGLPAMDLWTEPAEKLVERLKSAAFNRPVPKAAVSVQA